MRFKKNIFLLNSFFYIGLFLINFSTKTMFLPAKKQFALSQSAKKLSFPSVFALNPIVEEIDIIGLKTISKNTVLRKIGIKEGDKISADRAAFIVKNLYETGYFSHVSLRYEDVVLGKIKLYIIVEEKMKVASFIFKGNSAVSQNAIEKKLSLPMIRSIDHYDMGRISATIKKMYAEKQYHNAIVTYEFQPLENNSVNVVIDISEGIYGRIKKISFSGNNAMSRKQLKEVIGSREDWLLGFLDRGGVFKKELVEYDRFQIENFYQSNGFFEARVVDVTIDEDKTGDIAIMYRISEGPSYTTGAITYTTDLDIDDFTLKNLTKMKKGDVYSKEKLRIAIITIKAYLGECGFMFANVFPKQKINREKNIIDVEFVIEKGKTIFVRNINIKGNTKTAQNVVRRELLLNEGELLTTKKLEMSKLMIQNLGFFAPQVGVMWNLQTVDQYLCDLDLILQEAKTGRFFFNVGVNNGGDAGKYMTSDARLAWYDSFLSASRVGITIQDSNWKGRGIRYFADGSYSHVDKSLSCGVSTKWLFDWPVSSGINFIYRTVDYEDFHQSTMTPKEKNRGANIQVGFRSHLLDMMLIGMSAGFDKISYENPIIPKAQFNDNPLYQYAFSEIVKRSFQSGTSVWTTVSFSDDKRNHPVFPTQGYQWIFDTKIAFPNTLGELSCDSFGFIKSGVDVHWYTPIIIEYNVVLHLHGYIGMIHRFAQCNIPYKELFHIGGQQTVRGFTFGQIGPTLLGSSLGASKAFFTNAEIQFPINRAASMNGVLFYDGGAAWDTIFDNPTISKEHLLYSAIENASVNHLIKNNEINYRHSVGIGMRLTAPMPLRIDWAFKLDHNRRMGERPYEFHISMEGSY